MTPEELRQAALDALGEHADERARDALAHGTLAIVPSALRWEASSGTIEAHRVILALDGAGLGGLRASPGAADAVCAALSAAIGSLPGEAMAEMALRWAPGARVRQTGYRDAVPTIEGLGEALVAYLRAKGEEDLARAVEGTRVERRPGSEVWIGLEADLFVRTTLTAAVRDLLDDEHAKVVVRA